MTSPVPISILHRKAIREATHDCVGRKDFQQLCKQVRPYRHALNTAPRQKKRVGHLSGRAQTVLPELTT